MVLMNFVMKDSEFALAVTLTVCKEEGDPSQLFRCHMHIPYTQDREITRSVQNNVSSHFHLFNSFIP